MSLPETSSSRKCSGGASSNRSIPSGVTRVRAIRSRSRAGSLASVAKPGVGDRGIVERELPELGHGEEQVERLVGHVGIAELYNDGVGPLGQEGVVVAVPAGQREGPVAVDHPLPLAEADDPQIERLVGEGRCPHNQPAPEDRQGHEKLPRLASAEEHGEPPADEPEEADDRRQQADKDQHDADLLAHRCSLTRDGSCDRPRVPGPPPPRPPGGRWPGLR